MEFDEDGSRKMEIDEMVTMFKTNHIDVTEDELCSLFFKGKKYRKQDINKLYLDFYQFMQFALSKKSDYDFSMFMRKVKEKLQKEEVTTKKDDDLLNEKEPLFLPMNFNLVLDYFIKKGKERQSQKKIRRAIKRMNNIMNPGTYPENDKDFRDGDEEEEEEKDKEKEKPKKQKPGVDSVLNSVEFDVYTDLTKGQGISELNMQRLYMYLLHSDLALSRGVVIDMNSNIYPETGDINNDTRCFERKFKLCNRRNRFKNCYVE